MSITSLAAVFDGTHGCVSLQQIDVPLLQAGQVLVRVEGCTLCGSDIHSIEGRRSVPVPTVLGHEIVGHIAEWGEGFTPADFTGKPLKIGDRVTWAVVANCRECFYCQRDLPQKCLNAVKYGHEAFRPGMELLGGLAEYCLLTAGTTIVRLPKDLPLEVVCPASCATATIASALENHQVADRVVLIAGAGLLGLTACAMVSVQGAAKIIAVDPQSERRTKALEFGATHTVTPEEVPQLISTLTHGYGADLAIELSGATSAFQSLLASLRMGGSLALVGAVFPVDPVSLPMERIVRRNLSLQGIHNYAPRHLQQAVEFLTTATDRFPFRDIVQHWYPLQEISQAIAASKRACNVRVGVKP